MKKRLLCAFGGLWLSGPLLFAQTVVPAPVPAAEPAAPAQIIESAPAQPSSLTGELMYQLLVGEITTQEGDPADGFALMLDAARKTNDGQLYQRATEIALQARSGDAALQAARAWRQALPESRDANRYVLQILVALNRITETADPLKAEIEMAPLPERPQALNAVPRAYARVGDKKLAAAVVEDALKPYLTATGTASPAWTTIARMRLAAADPAGALEAARNAQRADPGYEGPSLIALELMDPKLPQAEALVKAYLDGTPKPLPEVRMAYARALIDQQRYAESAAQLQRVVAEKPELTQAWLVLGTLQLQDNQLAQSQASFERYVALAERQPALEENNRGLAQAYLSLSQLAEKRKDFAAAEAWIAKIDNPELMVQAQVRRASLLASQGKLNEARQLIRQLPESKPEDARLKLSAEVGLLRDLKQYRLAYDLLAEASAKSPNDAELMYDQAMVAEKANLLPEMERLLKRVIEVKPDYHHAYNALGYSLADRNVRLPEARELIRKALTFAPTDPFIQDSLGWVEFRLGNQAEASRIFEAAYKAKPDAEIAAHYGEVLWSLGQRDKAVAIWKEGHLINPENETLRDTLKRLRVKL